jgi:solute carrier family 45 protein 1/2/4
MIAPIADSDPDPTTQIPWPAARSRQVQEPEESLNGGGDDIEHRTVVEGNGKTKETPGKRRMSTWDLITLSISMAGAQIAWTVELGYV